MRVPVHCGHRDTIRRRHRSQHLHQWRRTANSITISTSTRSRSNSSSHRCRRRCRCATSNTIAQTIEMVIAASLRSQRHQCQPDRRCTINNSTSKLASTLTMQCTKRISNTVAAANGYDIDPITDVHCFDAFSIICGTLGPVSNSHLQLVKKKILHTFEFLLVIFFSFRTICFRNASEFVGLAFGILHS